MNREEKRAEQKSRKRRLKWLEKQRVRDGPIQKMVSELEENYDDTELETAKVFLVDCLTQSGPFSEEDEDVMMEKAAQYYDLEAFDALFIVGIVDKAFAEEKESEPQETEH